MKASIVAHDHETLLITALQGQKIAGKIEDNLEPVQEGAAYELSDYVAAFDKLSIDDKVDFIKAATEVLSAIEAAPDEEESEKAQTLKTKNWLIKLTALTAVGVVGVYVIGSAFYSWKNNTPLDSTGAFALVKDIFTVAANIFGAGSTTP